jgi:DNA-directed RNA polymerase alpha subunit
MINTAHLDEIPVTSLALGTRALNCLKRAGIRTAGELKMCEAKDLLDIRQFGPACLVEVEWALDELGLELVKPDFKARR